MSAYDNAVLRRIASGDDTPREYRTLSRELATEVLRLRERVARADSDAAGYLADHAAAVLDLAAATARSEKAEVERDALRAAAQEYLAAKTATEAADCEEASCEAASAAAYAYADDADDDDEFEVRNRAAELAWFRRCEAKATAAQARDRHEAAEAGLRAIAGEGGR